ncbi:hypothetical protein Bca52824_056802 [Brassica carinata]|uniref:Uncharacterized protein n=1 Tax=Brassica carinata TaxID=52824 RepID=A0A8X7UD30_BRACI|nr:hypothetical protein Bca52824_056802 [Brassica carinata]
MNLCYKVHSSESCLSVLQEHSLAIEFNWFWFHSCKEFEAISMVRFSCLNFITYGNHRFSSIWDGAFYVETSLLKRVLGYCNTSLQLQRKFENPTCAVMKHTNPCGEAYQLAVIADPVAHLVVINWRSLSKHPVLSGGSTPPTAKAASHESHNRFNESLATLAVALVTAVNSKRIGHGELIVFSGVEMYRAEISVYDNVVKATFVLLSNTGPELTGRQALELIDNYFEANGDIGANHEMPTPQCLVEVSSSNLTVKRQTISVTKVVSLQFATICSSEKANRRNR